MKVNIDNVSMSVKTGPVTSASANVPIVLLTTLNVPVNNFKGASAAGNFTATSDVCSSVTGFKTASTTVLRLLTMIVLTVKAVNNAFSIDTSRGRVPVNMATCRATVATDRTNLCSVLLPVLKTEASKVLTVDATVPKLLIAPPFTAPDNVDVLFRVPRKLATNARNPLPLVLVIKIVKVLLVLLLVTFPNSLDRLVPFRPPAPLRTLPNTLGTLSRPLPVLEAPTFNSLKVLTAPPGFDVTSDTTVCTVALVTSVRTFVLFNPLVTVVDRLSDIFSSVVFGVVHPTALLSTLTPAPEWAKAFVNILLRPSTPEGLTVPPDIVSDPPN